MILIDAVFINDSGGKVLFDYLFSELIKFRSKKITFLIDTRIKNIYINFSQENIDIVFINGFIKRNKFYNKYGNQYSKILCLGNIPPPNRLKGKVYTYFHQRFYISTPRELNIFLTLKLRIKVFILNIYKTNSDYWLVQTSLMQDGLSNKFAINKEIILLYPFYPPLFKTGDYLRLKSTFLFVSNATPNKNHKKLIDAFCSFYDMRKIGKLTVTVDHSFIELNKYIEYKIAQGYPIINLGFVDRNQLYRVYNEHEYLIFPSLSESFGLGLVEAIENGCKVISADLSYTYEVCSPSLTFNPFNVKDICNALDISTKNELKPSYLTVYNKLPELIKMLNI